MALQGGSGDRISNQGANAAHNVLADDDIVGTINQCVANSLYCVRQRLQEVKPESEHARSTTSHARVPVAWYRSSGFRLTYQYSGVHGAA